MGKQFTTGDLVETKHHSFFMTLGEKVSNDTFRAYFGKAHKNGTFEHSKYAGLYNVKDLEEWK